jgi:hypothetical protein
VVERNPRRLLATLPQSDLEAVVRFFETLEAVRTERENAGKQEPFSRY